MMRETDPAVIEDQFGFLLYSTAAACILLLTCTHIPLFFACESRPNYYRFQQQLVSLAFTTFSSLTLVSLNK